MLRAYRRDDNAYMHMGIDVGEYAEPLLTGRANVALGTAAQCMFMPIFLPAGFKADQLALTLITGQVGAECRVGLYDNNDKIGMPENLLLDGGIFDLSTAGGVKTFAIAPALRLPELVWSAVFVKNVATGATVSVNNNGIGMGIMGYGAGQITTGGNSRGASVTTAYVPFTPKAASLGALIRQGSTAFPYVAIRRA